MDRKRLHIPSVQRMPCVGSNVHVNQSWEEFQNYRIYFNSGPAAKDPLAIT